MSLKVERVEVDMEKLELMLNKIQEVNDKLSELKAGHEVLSAVNLEQHGQITKEIVRLSDHMAAQNGRVTLNEKFREKIMTQVKTIPAVVSFVTACLTLLIAWLAIG